MLKLKKVFLFFIIFLGLFVSSSFAVDIVTRPSNSSVDDNDIDAESSITETANNTRNSTTTNNSSSSSSIPAVSTSDTTARSRDTALTTSDVIDIIVVAVGIVNILLGIAIIIRFK